MSAAGQMPSWLQQNRSARTLGLTLGPAMTVFVPVFPHLNPALLPPAADQPHRAERRHQCEGAGGHPGEAFPNIINPVSSHVKPITSPSQLINHTGLNGGTNAKELEATLGLKLAHPSIVRTFEFATRSSGSVRPAPALEATVLEAIHVVYRIHDALRGQHGIGTIPATCLQPAVHTWRCHCVVSSQAAGTAWPDLIPSATAIVHNRQRPFCSKQLCFADIVALASRSPSPPRRPPSATAAPAWRA